MNYLGEIVLKEDDLFWLTVVRSHPRLTAPLLSGLWKGRTLMWRVWQRKAAHFMETRKQRIGGKGPGTRRDLRNKPNNLLPLTGSASASSPSCELVSGSSHWWDSIFMIQSSLSSSTGWSYAFVTQILWSFQTDCHCSCVCTCLCAVIWVWRSEDDLVVSSLLPSHHSRNQTWVTTLVEHNPFANLGIFLHLIHDVHLTVDRNDLHHGCLLV